MAGAVEYTSYFSTERQDPQPDTNEFPGYDIKQSGSEVLVKIGALGNAEYLFIAIAPRSTVARIGSTW